jgi:predicted DNA-binding transcriptional regulator AlpA
MPPIPRDQRSPFPSETPNVETTEPTEIELWERKTVLKFFGGDKPLHPSTLYRGMVVGRYPRPILVAGNAARWVRSECEAAQRRMFDKRAEPRPKPTGRRGRPRKVAVEAVATE